MILPEGGPGLASRWRYIHFRHVFLDSLFTDLDAQLQRFTLDPYYTPQAVIFRHLSDRATISRASFSFLRLGLDFLRQ